MQVLIFFQVNTAIPCFEVAVSRMVYIIIELVKKVYYFVNHSVPVVCFTIQISEDFDYQLFISSLYNDLLRLLYNDLRFFFEQDDAAGDTNIFVI